jgi:hypothetical protein
VRSLEGEALRDPGNVSSKRGRSVEVQEKGRDRVKQAQTARTKSDFELKLAKVTKVGFFEPRVEAWRNPGLVKITANPR